MKVYPNTIYCDYADSGSVPMVLPLMIGIVIHYYNHSSQNLYMKVEGTGPTGWTTGSKTLGLLNSGSNKYRTLDNLIKRNKPSGEVTENITLTLKGYSDAGYSSLVYQYSREITVVFFDSDDGSWTLDDADDFDSGSVEGWSAINELNNDTGMGYPTCLIDGFGPVLSTAPLNWQALCMTQRVRIGGPVYRECRGRLQKTINTPNKNKVYAVLNIWVDAVPNPAYWCYIQYVKIMEDSKVLAYFGVPCCNEGEGLPQDQWFKVIVPLTPNATVDLKIVVDGYGYHDTHANSICYYYTWIDALKFISKD